MSIDNKILDNLGVQTFTGFVENRIFVVGRIMMLKMIMLLME